MARFSPDADPALIPYQSERLVYSALAKLDDDYLILHSYPWLRPDRDLRGAPLREGEADFVLLHPRHGLLVLEVKGGEPVLRDREWRRGRKFMKDPFTQASKSMHALLANLASAGIQKRNLTHGYAVVFPNCRYAGELPAHADKAVILDARHLDDLPQHIARALRAWGEKPRPLSAEAVRRARAALMPSLRLLRCFSASIEQANEQVVQMTEVQHATLVGLFDNPRVMVEGVAGSGKTLLALEAAVHRAARGERVQLVCYNRQLAEWLRRQVAVEPRLEAAGAGDVLVENFHALAVRLAAEAGLKMPTKRDQRFWEHDAAARLDQAIGLLRGGARDPTCDVLIVDEAQDFREDWWSALLELLPDFSESPLYAFLDLDQSLWERATPPPAALFPVRFSLRTNCRNTRRIASSGGLFATNEVLALPGMPLGAAVVHQLAGSWEEERGFVEAAVRRLLGREGLTPRQVALIGAASHANGALNGATELAGVAVTTQAEAWREGHGLLSTTARAFKGLEADVVVLHGLTELGVHFSARDLYVAWTRAKHVLIVVSKRGSARKAVARALQTEAS